MTEKNWEKRLARHLSALSKTERKQVIDYYREIYGDKREAGFSEVDILAEFGSPEECAARILAGENVQPVPQKREKRKLSPAAIVGMLFATLLLIVPLFAAAFALIASFFAVSLSGAVIAIAGVVYAIGAPIVSINSLSAAGVVAHFAIGIAACGVGCLLFVAFKLLTKYLVIGTGKALKILYQGRF